jgi:rubrerythrin
MPIRYSVPEVMEMAIQTEEGGKLFYDMVAGQCGDEKLRELFRFLAAEEDKHIRVFKDIAGSVRTPVDEAPQNWEEVAQYLKAVTDSRYFLGRDKALSLARACTTTETAIHSAIAFEKETLLFYLEAADMISGPNRQAVERLIQEERAHVRRLTNFASSCRT